jgi:hypothetical protein
MTSLFQTRRRAEEFAAAVDGPATRPAGSEETTRLLELVGTLRSQASAEPRAEFAGDLRTRLMAEAETALRPESANLLLPVRERGRRERRLVAAASAFVLVGGTATMAAAAQSSLPGEALYPIKRGIEQAEVGLSMSPAGKGKDLLDQASDRLGEVSSLVAADSAQSEPRVPATLAEFSEAADEGAALLFQAFEETGDPDMVVAVRTFAAQGIGRLETLAPEVGSDAQDELSAAAMLLGEIDRRAASLCGGCAPDLPAVEVPEIFLARAEVDRALDRAAGADLQNSHPVVVPKGAVSALQTPVAATPTDAAEPTPQATPDSDDDTADSPTPLPSPTLEQPDSWPTLLPQLGDGDKADADGTSLTGELTEGLTGDLTEGLTGAVETLLPDTGTGLGLVD